MNRCSPLATTTIWRRSKLREVRVVLCQSGAASAGVREFISSQYAALAAANKSVPILVRECSGVSAKITGRYGFGREVTVSVDALSAKEVGAKLASLSTA